MNKIIFRITTVFLCVLTMFSCVSESKLETPKSEELRIISLNGAITETLYALGLGDEIIGTDVTSTYPEAALNTLKVGHSRNLSAEGVISMNPTLVVVKEGEMNPDFLSKLQSSGIEILAVPHDNEIGGTVVMIKVLSGYFKSELSVVARLISNIDSKLELVAPLLAEPKVLFIYARGTGNLMVAGENTALESMIELAGGKNAISGFDSFKPLTPEALVTANPDVLLMFTSGESSLKESGGVWSINGMEHTNAYKKKKLILMDGLFLSGFTPRVGDAVLELNTKLSLYSEML